MKVAVLGSGVVAQTLGAGFLAHGHEVALGTRDPKKLESWNTEHSAARVLGFEEAAAFGDLIVLAVKGTAALDAVKLAGTAALAEKTVIDATNPIADAPPVNGVLQFFTGPNDSLMETLQKHVPSARFVKAFNSVGSALMVNPSLPGGKPSMFICGNDSDAKAQVSEVLAQFGWETEDMGAVEAARAIEPLCMLWCIPGFRSNDWAHAFKLLR
ncbi:MAG: NAD(P)-binding domain-containing protein [Candidatus Eisenbacteria bacterium]|uniref:NAD(P)-binding domain-containing protein n=1 Tax=Eiseniibacteriota bacterium TaxID=2212470 RepID=A0A956NGB1_UNCEI|nr:NAD(P)-binding domain-containing protein [Candidatus Eisenbacteria bacterium]